MFKMDGGSSSGERWKSCLDVDHADKYMTHVKIDLDTMKQVHKRLTKSFKNHKVKCFYLCISGFDLELRDNTEYDALETDSSSGVNGIIELENEAIIKACEEKN